jgi:CDP-glycerol glycerophosphotransferase (TagB/SpsB family)
MRVGFLFNHDQVHQVAHSLPIALALANAGLGFEIIVATTNKRLSAEVIRLGKGAIGKDIRLVELGVNSRSGRMMAKGLESFIPATKLLVYRDNLDFFRSLDALVVAEKTSLILKSRYRLDNLKIIHTRHGAGDRAIGFNKASSGFDHVLASGSKIRDRLISEAGLNEEAVTIVGYPKFDITPASIRWPQVDDEGRPIVLYNPHVSPHLSSWYTWGRKVLDFFLEHDEYYLIFAPHVMLFERPFIVTIDKLRIARAGHVDDRFLRAPNIHVDLGSRATTTMAYTNLADIYVGDVSSQVYEFLRNPRPCVFLNAHHVSYQGNPNYTHWRAGPVVEDMGQFERALRFAVEDHPDVYRPIQEELFAHSFDLSDEPSSLRAARAIAHLLGHSIAPPLSEDQHAVA